MHQGFLKRSGRVLGVAAVAASMLLVSACGGSGGTSGGGDANAVLTVSNESGGLWTCSFNPFNSGVSFLSMGDVYEPLMFVNALQNDKTTPWLATAFAWSNSNTTLTFTIRNGVKWNDGTAMTAADVLFTFDELKKFPALDLNSVWSVLSSVQQSGSDQIVFHFKTAATPYFYYIADQIPIIPQHVWGSIKDPVTYTDADPVATGMYVVKPCTPQNITYKPNSHYWQPGLPKVKTLEYPAFTSNDSANNYLATGQAQWGAQFIPNIQKYYLDKSSNYHSWEPPITQVSMFPNEKDPLLGNATVRKALSYATDRASASSIGEGGQEPPASQLGVVTQTYPQWIAPAAQSQNDYTYDPAKADQLLQSIGAVKGADGIYTLNGRKLSFTIINNGGYSDWVAALQTVAQGMKAAGIQLNVDNLSQNDYTTKLLNGQFQLAYYSETGGPAPYYELRQWLYSSNSAPIGQPAATNYERFSDPAVDKLFNQYAATADQATQKAIVGQLEQVMLNQVPIIPVTEAAAWYQYDTKDFTGWVTQQNDYAVPSVWQLPDWGQVLMHLQPK
ncbi:ABC transporter substrate-binding protein [Streptacidiphilus sp. PB12-B1b]|uniref:ABC transporter substrate-binding protein n=1 Tax=Streptacidiphilus sp. PB12-B1b TaxID=2705012 RepID=UPI0015FD769B|nr:ABC transporter substrate-binding protein [Streptacidiphilus sp. PB12-B1b]QMU77611.1 ABC transporter substrate-binding protein [Streptacidiphilus sp. PB12-B1b]